MTSDRQKTCVVVVSSQYELSLKYSQLCLQRSGFGSLSWWPASEAGPVPMMSCIPPRSLCQPCMSLEKRIKLYPKVCDGTYKCNDDDEDGDDDDDVDNNKTITSIRMMMMENDDNDTNDDNSYDKDEEDSNDNGNDNNGSCSSSSNSSSSSSSSSNDKKIVV